MAGSSSTPAAAKKTAAPNPTNPLEGADPLVGIAGIAEKVNDQETAEQHRAAVAHEYGQFVATQAITHGGALAYNVGDPVPAANVERWGYEGLGLVRRVAPAVVESDG